jgi:hypothetical protein
MGTSEARRKYCTSGSTDEEGITPEGFLRGAKDDVLLGFADEIAASGDLGEGGRVQLEDGVIIGLDELVLELEERGFRLASVDELSGPDAEQREEECWNSGLGQKCGQRAVARWVCDEGCEQAALKERLAFDREKYHFLYNTMTREHGQWVRGSNSIPKARGRWHPMKPHHYPPESEAITTSAAQPYAVKAVVGQWSDECVRATGISATCPTRSCYESCRPYFRNKPSEIVEYGLGPLVKDGIISEEHEREWNAGVSERVKRRALIYDSELSETAKIRWAARTDRSLRYMAGCEVRMVKWMETDKTWVYYDCD